jgi:hypothetical protein
MKNNTTIQSFNTVRLLILLGFLLTVIIANAQTDITITAQGDAERKVPFTERLTVLPKVIDTNFNAYPVSYKLIPVYVDLNLIPVTIDPVKLTVLEPLQKLYKGYFKGGVGNFLNTFGDFYYASTRSKEHAWGINMKHFSSQGGLKNLGENSFSDNLVSADYQYFKNRYSIIADVRYERNAINYYGFNPANFSEDLNSTVLSKDANFQRFNIVESEVKYQTHLKDSLKVNTNLGLTYRFMDDNRAVAEHYVKVEGEEMKLMKKEVYYINYSVDYNNFFKPNFVDGLSRRIDSRSTQENGILNINPNVRTSEKNWSVRIGLAVQADINESAKFYFFPDAEADYRLFNDVFVPYAGVKGGVQRNSFYSLTRENPFITSDVDLKNTINKYSIYGGVRGSISSKISFNLNAKIDKFENFALFVNDQQNFVGNGFKIIYDTVVQTTFSAQASYTNYEKLKIYLRGEYFLYDMNREEQAWNRPNYTVTLSGVYDLADKILVRSEVFVVGDRPVQHVCNGCALGGYQTLKPFVDFNLGFEYRYTQRLSAFLNFNNIVSRKYQFWNALPVQGFNVLGGITYRF